MGVLQITIPITFFMITTSIPIFLVEIYFKNLKDAMITLVSASRLSALEVFGNLGHFISDKLLVSMLQL